MGSFAHRAAPRSWLALAALACAWPAHTVAGLPEPRDPTLELVESVAGVSVGMPFRQAKKQLGGKPECRRLENEPATTHCVYKDDDRRKGYILLSGKSGTFDFITVDAGFKGGRYRFRGPLLEIRSSEGVGLGADVAVLTEAFPQTDHPPGTNLYFLEGEGGRQILFRTAGPEETRITGFTFNGGGLGPPPSG